MMSLAAYGERMGQQGMKYRLSEGQLAPAADPAIVARFVENNPIPLPKDYLDFMRTHDGGEGFRGETYVVFWKVEELATFNEDYEVQKYAPGLFLFGSNGGGEGFGFDANDPSMPVVVVPFIGMDLNSAIKVAARFSDLFAPDFKLKFG